MKKITHCDRVSIVRQMLESLPEDDIDRRVSIKYMENYSEIDIRIELQITRKALQESRKRIKQMLLEMMR
jgi:hypothetical protein